MAIVPVEIIKTAYDNNTGDSGFPELLIKYVEGIEVGDPIELTYARINPDGRVEITYGGMNVMAAKSLGLTHWEVNFRDMEDAELWESIQSL